MNKIFMVFLFLLSSAFIITSVEMDEPMTKLVDGERVFLTIEESNMIRDEWIANEIASSIEESEPKPITIEEQQIEIDLLKSELCLVSKGAYSWC